jgi:peptidyl-prolyl cis-trans isomerase B (cyclophilin B)
LNRKIASITSLLILTGLVPYSYASSQNYLNPSLGLGFHIPEGWLVQELNKTQPDAPDIAIVAPYSVEFTPSISFSVEKADGASLDNYFENKKNQIVKDTSSQNVTFLSEQDITIDGYNAKTAILSEGFTTQGHNILIKFKEAFVLANNRFYVIIYANEAKNFDASLSSYDTLLGSIIFTNEQNSLGTSPWLPIGVVGAAIAIGAILVIKKWKKP